MIRDNKIILCADQRKELEKGYRFGSGHRYRARCCAILLNADGSSEKEIADLLKFKELTISKWILKYDSEGISGLKEKGGRGPKALLTSINEEAIEKAFSNHLDEIKSAKSAWKNSKGQKAREANLSRFLELIAQDVSV